MSSVLRVGAVLAGLGAYFVGAVAALVLVKRLGEDLSKLESRSRPAVLLVGGAANVLVLGGVLGLTHWLLGRPLSALGLGLSQRDGAFALTAGLLTLFSAAVFVRAARPDGSSFEVPKRGSMLALALGVLLLVALQEETLFRGYLALVLVGAAPVWVAVLSTSIFVLAHFPTNRVDGPQIASWTLGGLVLVAAYLLSGSLWVPAALHFAMDAANVLVFRIARDDGLFVVEPPLASSERALFRAVHALLLAALLFGFYGARTTDGASALHFQRNGQHRGARLHTELAAHHGAVAAMDHEALDDTVAARAHVVARDHDAEREERAMQSRDDRRTPPRLVDSRLPRGPPPLPRSARVSRFPRSALSFEDERFPCQRPASRNDSRWVLGPPWFHQGCTAAT